MRTTIRRIFVGLMLLSVAPITLAQPSLALEEVVVTAAKRTQTLQEVPLAVSVVNELTMEQSQVNDIIDLQSLVPSLRVSQLQSSGQTNFIIRGFGNGANNPGIEPSVGVFIDGVYRSRSASALSDLPNLERIEVLRGPQSTLFGKNASAGIIKVSTRLPNMNELEGSGTFTYGNDNQIIVKGDINGPLSDSVGFSLSMNSNQRDGYFKNLETGSDLNERDRRGVRGELLFMPSDTSTFRVIADYDEIDEVCCSVANLLQGDTFAAIALVGGQQVANNGFAYENYFDFDPTNKIENKGISLKADFDFSNDMLLTSITAYREQSRFDNVDVDFTSARALGQNTGDTNLETFTQELRLSQSTDSVDWMVGAFYFKEDVRYDNDIRYDVAFRPYADLLSTFGVTALEQALQAAGQLPPVPVFFGAGQGAQEFSTQDDETITLFTQADWHITDRVTLTGGLNYTEVDKSASVRQINTDVFSSVDMVQVGFGTVFGQLTGLPPTPANIGANPGAAAIAQSIAVTPCNPATPTAPCNSALGLQPLQFLPPLLDFPNAVESGISKDDKITYTAVIAFQATDNVNIYARTATGFKATSWNLSRDSRPFARDLPALLAAGLGVPNIVADTRYAGPEEAESYELGMKGNWGNATLNLAIFDQSIKGFQSNIFTGTGFSLSNAGKQSTKGIEVDALWNPTEALQLSFGGTWLDPKYDEFPQGVGVNGPEDLSGTTPPGISKISLSTSAIYYFEMGNVQSFIRGEWFYEDKVQVIENVPADIASREVSMFNASLGFAWPNGFEVTLWGRNLTNDEFLQSAFPSVAQRGSYGGYPNQPRSYGASFKYSF